MIMACRTSAVAAALLLVQQASAHSWVHCTDYDVAQPEQKPLGPKDPDPARSLFDESKCHAYPRDYKDYYTKGGEFALDRGFDYQMGESTGQWCKTSRNGATDYTPALPKATYTQGQTVCLAYPAKNHVAAPCTNQYIPDTDFKIFRSAVNPTSDPSLDQFKQHNVPHYNGVHKDGTMDYKGFQNCPGFCDPNKGGTGAATCTVCFTLEDNLTPGEYTFLWYWRFNADMAPYSSCWEATVKADNGGGPSPTPRATHKPTAKSPTPTPKPTNGPNPAGSCFCPCAACDGCWKRCKCSTPSAKVLDPFRNDDAPSPTPKATRKPTAKSPTPTPKATVKPTAKTPAGGCVSLGGQCGGRFYNGATCCSSGSHCIKYNDYFSQCLEN